MRKSLNESADLQIMKNLSNNALYEERSNESADLMIMKSLTVKEDSFDLAVPLETGVERHSKTYLKSILNEMLIFGS